MKTAAAVIIVLALAGVFGKDKKKTPPPTTMRTPVFDHFECGDPRTTPFDDAAKQRILKFGMGHKKDAVSDDVMNEVAHYIVVYATVNCIEPELAAAFIARESRFNPRAVSSSGAKGLGQLIDSTARMMGVTDPFDIQQNLRGSIAYFKKLMDQCAGYPDQTDRAIASYLMGPANVEKSGVSSSARGYINDIYAYREKIKAL